MRLVVSPAEDDDGSTEKSDNWLALAHIPRLSSGQNSRRRRKSIFIGHGTTATLLWHKLRANLHIPDTLHEIEAKGNRVLTIL